MSAGVERLLEVAFAALSEARVEFALIGACARNLYAEPRATRDVDLAVTADPAAYVRVVAAFAARGFAVGATVGDKEDVQPDLVHFRDAAGDRGDRIDILFAKTSFEREALARRIAGLTVGETRFPAVTPEDLVIYKLIAARPQDLLDAEEVAATMAASD